MWDNLAAMKDKPLKPRKKTSYHHGNLRQSMLQAADEILISDGLPALTLRACARAAGVSHAAPAHHFGDLKGLLTALSAESFTMLGDQTEEVRKTIPTARMFGALGRIYVSFATQHPDRFRIMMRRDIVYYDNPEFHAAAKRCFTSMTNIIALARGDSEVALDELATKGETEPLALDVVLTWSLIHGFAHLRIEGNFDPFAVHMAGDRFDDIAWGDIGRRIGALIAPIGAS